MKFLDALRGPQQVQRNDMSFQDWINAFQQNVLSYPGQWPGYQFTYGKDPAEPIANSFAGYVAGGFQSNGVIFALELKRIQVFSQARFQYQRMRKGRPGELFGDDSLMILERPWPGGTTGDMLARMILDADFAGNNWQVQLDGEVVRLRPDYVEIVLAPRMLPLGPDGEDVQVGFKQVGILYYEGGIYSGVKPAVFLPGEYSHFAPIPDPLAAYRGMSWLTPVIRELQADTSATKHKLKFFENAATPNLAVSLPKEITPDQFAAFVEKMDATHKGVDNAYKTLYTGGGADVTVIGANMQQLDFKVTQGAGEPLALDTPIPTPTGWTTMGEIEPGDRVIGRDGRPANVLAVSPIHEGRVCYRVTLSDRTSIVADASHLWVAVDRNTNARVERTYTTQELYDLFVRPFPNGAGGNRLFLPPSPIVDLSSVDLLVDPYVLGAWLGDGMTAGAAICGADDDLAVIAAEIQGRGYTVTQWKTGEDKVSVLGLPGGLLAALRALGVLGDKHIPDDYLRSSAEQRLDLLRGLMDTDGHIEVSGKGSCEYSSKDGHLARQVAELVRSLGYRATLSSKADSRSRTGMTWRVFFRVSPDRIPFLLPRKVDRCLAAGEPHYRNRAIVSIEPVASVSVRCIAVDTTDHLFLAGEGFVPTHNTRLAAAAGIHPVVVALSEGMQGSSLNAGNYTAAKRNTVDTTFRHLWQNAAGSLEPIVSPPDKTRLWYDARDIPFLHEDQKDVASIQQAQASAWRQLVDGGMDPDAATAFISSNDLSVLMGQHSGLYSVQLQPPGPNQGATGETVPKAPAADAARSILADEWDDDPIGDLDEDTEALIYALSRYAPKAARALSGAAFNAKHKRGPGGRFLTMVDRVINALNDHKKNGGKGDPFAGFDRPQLMNAAKARGIPLKRGEDRDSIAAKLLADLGGSAAKPKPANAPNAPATPSPAAVTTKPGAKWPTGDATTEVHLGGDQLGIVVHSSKTGGFFPFVPSSSKKTPLGNVIRVQPGAGGGYQTEQSAVDAIVRAHTPSKVSGPGLAGLTLTELRIEPQPAYPGARQLAKTSHEISQNGSPIGTVHDFGYGWEARDPQGKVVRVSQGSFTSQVHFKTKSDALNALVSAHGTPAAPKTPAAPVHTPAQQTSAHGPEIQAALDVLYGKDSKGHTIARQMAVYGALRRNQFDQLGPREQSTVLGDLSFIAATAKGKNAADAANLVHRFTPAGTTPGTVNKQAIHVPAHVAAAQTRVADPNGTPGLLKVRDPKDRGVSGDGWTRLPNGGTGPWGKYGAAGVMLRHVDPADGKERFLMVQRGPGISDPGKWQFPGGAIDSKESPHEGAARETVEELGFQDKDMLGARVHGTHEVTIPGSTWKYTSIAATVGRQLKPDLSTHHARMETADAKWMTRDEIKALDSKGKLLKPLAGGQLETNVMSLFPSNRSAPAAMPGAPAKRPPRLTGTPIVTAHTVPTHKPSSGRDLLPDKATKDALRQQIKKDRKKFAGKAADDRLAAIGAMQGFDDVPTVMSKKDMDDLLKTGDYIEAWRGVKGMGSGWGGPTRGGAVSNSKTAHQINEEFRSGPAYYGNGIYGNGYYFATQKSIAQGYSDGTKGSLMRVLIPKKAKIVNHAVVLKESRAAGSPLSKAKGVHEPGTLYDEGRYAAAKGFDMIEIDTRAPGSSHVAKPGKPAFNILNRSVLIVEEA